MRAETVNLDLVIHLSRIIDTALQIEIEMRQQVRLVEEHQIGRGEHVGIFERFVFALRH